MRAQRAEDRLKELCDAGNLSAVVRDLHACYDSGAFDDNEAALNFIKDLVQYANNRNDDGSGGTGTRYSESTKRIFGLIDKLGGPKTHFALQANAGGTSLSAVKRHWRKSRTDFESGIHAAAFIATAEVLRPYIAKLKSEGGLQEGERLLTEISIDETGIIAKGTFREATDEYIGFCGRHDDVNHKCSAVAVKLGDDAGTQARIDDWSENGKAANYGSLFLFNPLSLKLPRLAVAFKPTCNTDTAKDVAAENKLLGDLFREHISSQLPIDLTGFSSDGDARRTANQKQNMTGEIASANAFSLGHAGFALHGRVTDGGSITDIEGQESKHVTKCTIGALAGKRNLQLGEYTG